MRGKEEAFSGKLLLGVQRDILEAVRAHGAADRIPDWNREVLSALHPCRNVRGHFSNGILARVWRFFVELFIYVLLAKGCLLYFVAFDMTKAGRGEAKGKKKVGISSRPSSSLPPTDALN